MRKASAHWLRHTLATRAVASGTPIDVVAGIFGHANIATTSIYIQAERHRKLAEMRKLWSGANRAKPSSDVVG
jgi:site-specific recombinase XerD